MRYFHLLILFFLSMTLHAQIVDISTDSLYNKIMSSDADYRVLYVFHDACPCIMETLPNVLELLKDKKNAELFVICGHPKVIVEGFVKKNKLDCKYYSINPKKPKMIDFTNYMGKVGDFIEQRFGVDTKKMGASSFCILDRQGKALAKTTWETTDEEYMAILERTLSGNAN
ncbi:hypothetical protein HPS57_08365 [Prevotella sp. PINT]|uniref:hypothetical protein n=1 Tax=Palleniella intestinalis TaxID=2736291 RepID=UPI0015528A8B|nr:hypothetical protein [Palleniella intestinalis]NPD81986.1 hypothetical protein [Palleniella intestinalis]